MSKIQRVPTCDLLPPDYISAEELAAFLRVTPRWAQKIIKKTVPDSDKIRVGHAIYAPCSKIALPGASGGNENLRSPDYQSIVSRMRWHPEEREALAALLVRFKKSDDA